jgi:hypothetical protein
VEDAPASEIYSQARVKHAPARGRLMTAWLMAAWSGGAQERDGGAREMVGLFEVERSDFEKIKSQKLQKGGRSRLRWAGGGGDRPSSGGKVNGGAAVYEQNLRRGG